MKDQLIRLGSEHPELREHIRPLLKVAEPATQSFMKFHEDYARAVMNRIIQLMSSGAPQNWEVRPSLNWETDRGGFWYVKVTWEINDTDQWGFYMYTPIGFEWAWNFTTAAWNGPKVNGKLAWDVIHDETPQNVAVKLFGEFRPLVLESMKKYKK